MSHPLRTLMDVNAAGQLPNRGDEEPAEGTSVRDVRSAATGAVAGGRALVRLGPARDVARTLEHLRRRAADLDYGEWLRQIAEKTRTSIGPDGKSGALGQLRGH